MRIQSKTKGAKFTALSCAVNPVCNSVFNSLDVAITVFDSNGYFVDVNNSYCKLMGYERKELIGRFFLTVIPEILHEQALRNFRELITSPEPQKQWGEFPLQRKDRCVFGAQSQVAVLTEGDGARYMMITVSDVADNNHYKQLLEETETATGIGGWELNVYTNKLICTEGLYNLLGITRANVISWEDILGFVGNEGFQRFKRAVQDAIDWGTPFNIDIELSNGKLPEQSQWIRAIGRPKQIYNKTVQLFGTFQDITQLKQTELLIHQAQRAKEMELRNQKMLQQAERVASVGSWETDLTTGLTIWSDELYRILGWENHAGPMVGLQLSTVHPDDLEFVMQHVNDTLTGKCDLDIVHRCLRPDGGTRYIRSQGELIRNEAGVAVKMIGVVHDITEQKAAEEKLREQEARLIEEKVNHQRQIARATINTQEHERAEIGKELHDNVNQILASAKLFLASPFMESEERNSFIKKASEYIHTAIEEIRKLSKTLVSPSAADLGIIETINDLIGDIQWAQRIEVCFNHTGIDEKKLDNGLKLTILRIVQEQLNNIMKYASPTQIGIIIKEVDSKLMLMISDNGKGFDPILKRKGIGLNNIINRADVFNGKVDIESAPGQGCVLKVLFEK